jgi:hypothetical protein
MLKSRLSQTEIPALLRIAPRARLGGRERPPHTVRIQPKIRMKPEGGRSGERKRAWGGPVARPAERPDE